MEESAVERLEGMEGMTGEPGKTYPDESSCRQSDILAHTKLLGGSGKVLEPGSDEGPLGERCPEENGPDGRMGRLVVFSISGRCDEGRTDVIE